MGFAEDIYRLSAQIAARQAHCKGNEEATKHALILPFFQALGFDVYDPSVLMPEYKAGFASNKEKIDYAIFLKGQPALFVEAKAAGEKLENHDAQLAKYFNATPGLKLAVITDGVRYKFFTDLKEPNLLDPDPFFEFDLEAIRPEEIEILQRFRADAFDAAGLVSQAEDLVYLRALKRIIRGIFRDPSEEFVRFVGGEVYPRRITANVLERLTPLVRQAMSTVLVEMVSQGLIQEIAKIEEAATTVPASAPAPEAKEKQVIVPTEDELAAYAIVKEVISKIVGEDSRILNKPTTQYFGIQVEKPSRWFARLFLGSANKSVVLRLPAAQANALAEGLQAEVYAGSEEQCRVVISEIKDLYRLQALILAAYRAVCAGQLAQVPI